MCSLADEDDVAQATETVKVSSKVHAVCERLERVERKLDRLLRKEAPCYTCGGMGYGGIGGSCSACEGRGYQL